MLQHMYIQPFLLPYEIKIHADNSASTTATITATITTTTTTEVSNEKYQSTRQKYFCNLCNISCKTQFSLDEHFIYISKFNG